MRAFFFFVFFDMVSQASGSADWFLGARTAAGAGSLKGLNS
jgi:hypothetical protein